MYFVRKNFYPLDNSLSFSHPHSLVVKLFVSLIESNLSSVGSVIHYPTMSNKDFQSNQKLLQIASGNRSSL